VKILLVTMYFPPAGGGGVQRPLKMAQYLPALGIETHVLAPDDPKWVHRDPDLRVPTQAWVHRVRYLGPRARRPAEELRASSGVERAVVQAQVTARRLLLPDASVSWNLTAIPAAMRIVRREGIDAVVTTSPPGSVHLVGAAVQRATGAAWLADLRDPLVANQQRRSDTVATRARQATNERLARLVARRADAISCVSDAIAEEVRALGARGVVRTIANGCDFDDFAGLAYEPAQRFRITHAGSFFGQRDPRPFLQALRDSGLDVVARFAGDFRSTDRGLARARRPARAHPVRSTLGVASAPARLGGPPPARAGGRRSWEGRALRKGVRVSRRRPAHPRRRPARRRRRRARA
jgi:glycosyltransferase involved in cell wall biosynthesis